MALGAYFKCRMLLYLSLWVKTAAASTLPAASALWGSVHRDILYEQESGDIVCVAVDGLGSDG
jgi:hypothetical protein